MEVKIINDLAVWDAWATKNSASFLQSFAWGEVLISENKPVERLAVTEGGEVLAQAQCVYNNLPFNNKYVFCPGGPVITKLTISKEQLTNVWRVISNYFLNKNIVFLRVEPPPLLIVNCSLLINKVADVNPSSTAVTSLMITEEEFFVAMNKKTRHDAKKAERQDLLVSEEKNFEVFWKLMQGTAKRDGFTTHDSNHYAVVLNSPNSYQLTAFYQGLPVAVVLLFGFSDTLTYLFAAADYNYHELLASYRLQLAAFRLGKKLGYKFYDWFGVAPRHDSRYMEHDTRANGEYIYNPKHRYAGITRFKLGFGGKPSEAPGTFDLVISPAKYYLYRILRKIRRVV